MGAEREQFGHRTLAKRAQSCNKGRAPVAVVIPSWNTLEYIGPCVASVRDETELDVELLVIDNGSVDESVEFLRQEGIAHIGLSENVGFAGAINLAAHNTQAPLLLVLNADVILETGCLRTLVDAIVQDSALAGVQPKIVAPRTGDSTARIYSAGQALTVAATAYEIGAGEPDGPAYSQAHEIFGVCGAVCLLRRELFTDLGGYDERYFAFYEDVDLNARARLAGWRFAYVPDAVASHVGHASWGKHETASAFNVRLTMQNRISTAVKVFPASCLPWVLLATVRSLIASPFRGVGRPAMAGTLSFMVKLPGLLRERRHLRGADGSGLDPWLVARRIDRVGQPRG
ncbi:MAG: glycosyltransferase family 2 protein [Solirubrobacteraceae bacterium]